MMDTKCPHFNQTTTSKTCNFTVNLQFQSLNSTFSVAGHMVHNSEQQWGQHFYGSVAIFGQHVNLGLSKGVTSFLHPTKKEKLRQLTAGFIYYLCYRGFSPNKHFLNPPLNLSHIPQLSLAPENPHNANLNNQL